MRSPGTLKAYREQLALILDELMSSSANPIESPDAYEDRRRRNVYFALALGAELGYNVGHDPQGFAHVELPSGHVAFWIGSWDRRGQKLDEAKIRAAAEDYFKLVFPPEQREGFSPRALV